jgi:MFS family permease
VASEPTDRSYRALLGIPDLPQVVLSMQFARVGQSMVAVALVLFTLAVFGSPLLAGLVTFASVAPGIVLSPVAGALLDRYGRVRLIRVDYLVAMAAMLLVGGLSIAGLLSAPLLVAIAAISSVTAPLSGTGLRSLFPIMVPEPLWERINAVDSNGYLIASIFGAPLAAGLVAIVGPQLAVMSIGIPYGLAVVALQGMDEPQTQVVSSGRLLRDALDGLWYAWRNRTIRGLAFAIGMLNLASGVETIAIPLLVLNRLHAPEFLVGVAFALSGVAGVASVFVFGRIDSRGREWTLLAYPMFLTVPVIGLLLLANNAAAIATPALGLGLIAAAMIALGVLNGPMDIGLFTIRQRRTDAAWMGRAFAISMALNFSGFPIGAAVAGALAAQSLDTAILAAIAAAAIGAVFAAAFVPRREPAAG